MQLFREVCPNLYKTKIGAYAHIKLCISNLFLKSYTTIDITNDLWSLPWCSEKIKLWDCLIIVMCTVIYCRFIVLSWIPSLNLAPLWVLIILMNVIKLRILKSKSSKLLQCFLCLLTSFMNFWFTCISK